MVDRKVTHAHDPGSSRNDQSSLEDSVISA